MNESPALPDLIALRTVATAAARTAGAVLREGADTLREVTYSDARDVKLRADTTAEQLIRERLAGATDIPLYGEELGGDARLVEEGALLWVVDPLDGTFNYLRGLPICAVSIGLMRGTEPLLGVIYDFHHDVLLAGSTAEALTANGQPIVPAWATSLDQAALCTGFPAGLDRNAASLQRTLTLLAPYKKVRMVGSAAMALAMVAGGQADAYFEPSIRLWDVAAGLALVQAAGGVFEVGPSASDKPLAYDVWAAARPEFILR
ncbi:MAG: inositol monophosphatase family protein [Verrucomicrobiota bacterium]